MRIKEKTQRRLRNAIITLAIICLTPVFEEGRILSGAHTSNVYAGLDLVCAIQTNSSNRMETGLNYELIRSFAEDNHCNVNIVIARNGEDYLDSLSKGKVDIFISNNSEIVGNQEFTTLTRLDDNSVWLTGNDSDKVRQMDNWIGWIKSSDRYNALRQKYRTQSSPYKMAEMGLRTSSLSPYDSLIKKHAASLGWDWRMVAAIIYQESKFSISSKSPRGALGLMQIMPNTGRHYGVDNLLDPEQNIIAGVSLLKTLKDSFTKEGLEDEEVIRFCLASYNAGRARVMDCRRFAAAKGYDDTRWEEVVKVIPLMREDSILEEESVRLGKFNGKETISYVEKVGSHYETICQITSL